MKTYPFYLTALVWITAQGATEDDTSITLTYGDQNRESVAAKSERIKDRDNIGRRDEKVTIWKESLKRNAKKAKKLSPPVKKSKRPNIILIMTDDQDVELGSLNFMPKSLRLLKDSGAFFPNAYVTTPTCCPSRSSMLTGMYVHNHHVSSNNENCSSTEWKAVHEHRTFAKYLSDDGYRTGYFGKYLNKYDGSYVPPGWREWAGLIMNSRFYNYSVNINGQKIKHADDYNKDYYPDLISNDSVTFLHQSKHYFPDKPIMLVMSFPSPHGPEDSAPQYSHMFHNVTVHHTPSYDYAPNADKQWILRVTERMSPVHRKFTDMLMTKRLQTLLSVDDAVEKLCAELDNLGELDNTYIFYTSDHGYHLGQFGLIKGKSYPFEFDIKVPFIVRGPGITPGSSVPGIVLNIDLAPTFLDIAGIKIPQHMDGTSFFPLLSRRKKVSSWRQSFLVERGRILPEAMKHDHTKFTSPTNKFNKFDQMALECRRDKYASPCKLYQKRECVLIDGRWRMKKCRNFPLPARVDCNCNKTNKSTITNIDTRERRNQRNFVKDKLGKDWWDTTRPKFVKIRREKRSMQRRESFVMAAGAKDIEQENFFNEAMVDREIEAIDDIILDISDELSEISAMHPLNSSHTMKNEDRKTEVLPMHLFNSLDAFRQKVNAFLYSNCTEDNCNDVQHLRTKKFYLDDQIRLLKTQLKELKTIRRHLKRKQPTIFEDDAFDYDTYADYDEYDDDKPNPFQNFGVNRRKSGSSNRENDDKAGVEEPDLIVGKPLNENTPEAAEDCDCSIMIKSQSIKKHRKESIEQRRMELLKLRHDRKLKKLRKKEKKLKKKSFSWGNEMCLQEKVNCFVHDNEHWKTPPLWTDGPFCFCINSNNNSYWCLRTINDTHNYLYCEFMTNFVMFYDMSVDPFQLRNIADTLSDHEKSQMRLELERLRHCEGSDECQSPHVSLKMDNSLPHSGDVGHFTKNRKRELTHNLSHRKTPRRRRWKHHRL